MSRADELYKATCRKILEEGFSDEGLEVRPKWEDGTPAHTIKTFGVVNRYNLAEEFPIMTLRRTYWKSAIDELLWIWQKKSSRVCDLGSHVWDEWAGDDGTIGKAYGYQLGKKYQFQKGAEPMDQVDRVLYDLKHNPASRRILTSIYNFEDLHEMNLYPCASERGADRQRRRKKEKAPDAEKGTGRTEGGKDGGKAAGGKRAFRPGKADFRSAADRRYGL